MSTFFIHQLTPDNRLWRIDWLGQVDYQPGRHSQPCFRVTTSPVLCDPNDQNTILSTDSTDHRHQRQVWLPIGILYLVKIGDIWQNGQRVYTPNYQTEIFRGLDVKKESTNFIKAGISISDSFLLPLNEHPWHRLQTQSYCIIVTLPDEKCIIIPCLELIRFYFGSSSKFLHILFTKQITVDMFWKNMHFDHYSGRLHLQLADGLSGMSATDIGRMALDPIAWNAARLIFHSGMSASVQREAIYSYTGFPFIGETDLTVTGKWLSYGSKPNATFVIFNIKSCSHPFPYKSLSYEVSDNQKVGIKQQSSIQPGQDRAQKPSVGVGSSAKTQNLVRIDPGKSLSGKEKWVEGSPRFPDLTNKKIWRERYDTNDPPEIIFLKSPVHSENVSVGVEMSSSANIRSIDVGQGLDRVSLSDIDPKKYNFIYDGIELVSSQAGLHAATAELVILAGYTHPVISLPHLIDENGEINSVSFCRDEHCIQRLRRGCFVEFKINEKLLSKVFIVETIDFHGRSVLAITMSNFDLNSAMELLVEENEALLNNPDGSS